MDGDLPTHPEHLKKKARDNMSLTAYNGNRAKILPTTTANDGR